MIWIDKHFDFSLASTTEIYYGKGRLAEIPALMKKIESSRPLLVTSPSIRKAGLVDRVVKIMGKNLAGIFEETRPHSPIEIVRKALSLFEAVHADGVISLGGGSSVDTAKGVVHLQLEENQRRILHLAVPTTLSGAEFTQDAGITYGERKRVHHGLHMTATAVLLDPEAARITPPSMLLPSGLNAMHHCIEGVCSIKANGVTEALFLHAIRLLRTSLPRIGSEPENLELRGTAQVGAALAALAVGDLPMGMGHAFAHAICGKYKTPHAQTHAIVIVPVMEFNHDSVIPAQAAIGEALGAGSAGGLEEIAREGIARVRSLLKALGIPENLSKLGVRQEGREMVDPDLVEGVMNDRYFKTNPKPADAADVARVLRTVL